MVKHLASIFGMEKDRVNCPFHCKIGACKHGDRCSSLHTKTSIIPTLLLSNMYKRPGMITMESMLRVNPSTLKRCKNISRISMKAFLKELNKDGEIEILNICDNLADHMVGNVYVQFREEEQAANVLNSLTGRFYAGTMRKTCYRGGYCNFMHLKRIGRELRHQLFGRSRRSAYRHHSHKERPHGGRIDSRRDEDRDYRESHIRRHINTTPSHRNGRNRIPDGRRDYNSIREGS